MTRLHVHRWGSGPPVVLVHGAVLGGRESFRAQRPLTERWTLLAPDRLGHGASPDGPTDFELDARMIVDQLLDRPVHVLGYSYGGIVAMLAAAERPGAIRSLTVVEPPAMSVARGHPAVDLWAADERGVFGRRDGDLRSRLARFFAFAGVPLDVPDPLPPAIERGTRALASTRPPGEAVLPLDALARAPFPKLVVTGGHKEGYEVVADAIAGAVGAQRHTVRGMAHLVPDTGAPFNEALERFLIEAERDGLRRGGSAADTDP